MTSHSAQEIRTITQDQYGPDATAYSDHQGGITIDAAGLHASVPRQRSRILDWLTSDHDDPAPPSPPGATCPPESPRCHRHPRT